MDKPLTPGQPNQNPQAISDEEKRARAERAFELEQLEDREYQGTYRNVL